MYPFNRKKKVINDFTPKTWFLRGILVFVSSVLITTTLSLLIYRWVNPNLTILMVSKHYKALKEGKNSKINKDWVNINLVSPNMVLAAVAAEDNNFLNHWGFDIKSIRKAMESNKKGRKLKGASTISQQTAKNMFLWPRRSWIRKGFEAYFTICMEALWSKKRIMEVYLNIAEFGSGVYGVEAAAQKYYKKPSQSLNKMQAAMLTTVLPNPTKRNPTKASAYMIRYQQRVLWNMNNIGSVEFSNPEKEIVVRKSKTKSKR